MTSMSRRREYVIEGFLDPPAISNRKAVWRICRLLRRVKRNPMLRVTAITHREDALFQTVTIGAVPRARHRELTTVKTEAAPGGAVGVGARAARGLLPRVERGMYNLRVSLRQRVPGDAKNAIAAFSARTPRPSMSSSSIPTSMCSRRGDRLGAGDALPADRDLIVGSGFRVVPLDPSLGGAAPAPSLASTAPFLRKTDA